MEITYIGHSGFLIEWETCYWLFDYYKGELPKMRSDKKIFIFASHKHADHFNPEIFLLSREFQNIEYVLSSDIRLPKGKLSGLGFPENLTDKIRSVKPSAQFEMYDNDNNILKLQTLKSTDCGVAFLLYYLGKTIYHAGDLNLWVWKEAAKQYNNNMSALYQKQMEHLKDIPIDVAFVPLDPRLEDCYYMGMESFLNTAKVKYVFPMHFWEKPSVIGQFKKERGQMIPQTTVIMDVGMSGQKWCLDH